MIKPLSQIVSDGTLVDNTVHQASEGIFRGARHREEIEIRQNGRKWNHPWSVWPLMQRASQIQVDPSYLVLCRPEAEYEHNTNDPFISLSGFEPLNFTLTTGNVIGSISSDDYTLRVSSRFGDEFLRFIIADADGFVEVPDRGGMADGSYEWLLIHLWLTKLKRAFRLGLPKAYETRTGKLPQVRGRLDPVDYAINHRRAVYSCTYREHSYDNPATRLIARTLDHLDARSKLSGAHSLRQTFLTATNGRPHALQDLLTARPLRNPYFADYNPVMAMAKRILRRDLLDFGVEDRTSSFFFDVSMLWEYFIRQLLRRAGCTIKDKSCGTLPISSGLPGVTRRLIPDLVFEYGGRNFVFDVKYKNFQFGGPGSGVNREDLFQLHTYVGQTSNHFDVSGCGLIYPVRESIWHRHDLGSNGGILSTKIELGRHEIPLHVAFLMVPECGEGSKADWPSHFQRAFLKSIEIFLASLENALSDSRSHPSTIRPSRSSGFYSQDS